MKKILFILIIFTLIIATTVTKNSTKELDNTLKWYKPDIMVIGSDWKGKEVIGDIFADKLVFFDRVGSYSTTKISRKK